MYKLEDVQHYLSELMKPERVKQCYDLISNPELRVNTQDKKWVACTEDYEIRTVTIAISTILDLGHSYYELIDEKVKEVCEFLTLAGENNKPRIPFYVLVLHKLI